MKRRLLHQTCQTWNPLSPLPAVPAPFSLRSRHGIRYDAMRNSAAAGNAATRQMALLPEPSFGYPHSARGTGQRRHDGSIHIVGGPSAVSLPPRPPC